MTLSCHLLYSYKKRQKAKLYAVRRMPGGDGKARGEGYRGGMSVGVRSPKSPKSRWREGVDVVRALVWLWYGMAWSHRKKVEIACFSKSRRWFVF